MKRWHQEKMTVYPSLLPDYLFYTTPWNTTVIFGTLLAHFFDAFGGIHPVRYVRMISLVKHKVC